MEIKLILILFLKKIWKKSIFSNNKIAKIQEKP
jgi:hypothetical protein